MPKRINPNLLTFAREMRSNQTSAEALLWNVLRAKRFMNLKFRRQHVIEPYIVDFYCHEMGLVIELDGSQHAHQDTVMYDEQRTRFLEDLDLKVVRYWNHEVLNQTDVVLQNLWDVCLKMKDDN